MKRGVTDTWHIRAFQYGKCGKISPELPKADSRILLITAVAESNGSVCRTGRVFPDFVSVPLTLHPRPVSVNKK